MNFDGEYQIKKWKESGLTKPSVIRLSKRIILPYDALIFRIGNHQKEDADEVSNIYSRMYGT